MKFLKLLSLILVIFLKTGNVFSSQNIFNVNNIEIAKRNDLSSNKLVNKGIKKGFEELIDKILLNEDKKKLAFLELSQIKDLVLYYQVAKESENNYKKEKLIFNIFFDKEKIHNLFFTKGIFYSNITNKNLYLLPILQREDDYFIFNQNFFYDNWNKIYNTELLEFNLLLENIETIEKINVYRDNLVNLSLEDIFKEYQNENLALILIEEKNKNEIEVFLKNKILNKDIIKRIKFKRNNLNLDEMNNKVITETKKEIINIVKSQNLIDVRTPSFINVKLVVSKNNNLEELNKRLKKIDLIQRVFVQEFNNKNVFLRIKYLGKLEKIIKSLEDQDIILKLVEDEWRLKII